MIIQPVLIATLGFVLVSGSPLGLNHQESSPNGEKLEVGADLSSLHYSPGLTPDVVPDNEQAGVHHNVKKREVGLLESIFRRNEQETTTPGKSSAYTFPDIGSFFFRSVTTDKNDVSPANEESGFVDFTEGSLHNDHDHEAVAVTKSPVQVNSSPVNRGVSLFGDGLFQTISSGIWNGIGGAVTKVRDLFEWKQDLFVKIHDWKMGKINNLLNWIKNGNGVVPRYGQPQPNLNDPLVQELLKHPEDAKEVLEKALRQIQG